MQSRSTNIINQKFGKLLVINSAGNDKHGNALWLCKCDCGNEVVVRGSSLRSKNTLSCGCYRKNQVCKKYDLIHQKNRKFNTYKLLTDKVIGYITEEIFFYIDKDVYDLIKNYKWNIDKQGYIKTIIVKDGKRHTILLHRLITNCPNGLFVDHINHNKFDNRKCNLRICNRQENNRNRKVSKNNQSGFTGVYFNKQTNKWIAYIMVDKKQIYLGSFNDKNEAIKKRKTAQELYFKDFEYSI